MFDLIIRFVDPHRGPDAVAIIGAPSRLAASAFVRARYRSDSVLAVEPLRLPASDVRGVEVLEWPARPRTAPVPVIRRRGRRGVEEAA